MADSSLQLVAGTYKATRRPFYSTEVVRTDGGGRHGNSRWANRLAQWDVTIPFCKRNSAAFLAVEALFDDVLGSGRTFIFHDTVGCVDVEVVILDDTLDETPEGNLVQVNFAVEQARNDGDSP